MKFSILKFGMNRLKSPCILVLFLFSSYAAFAQTGDNMQNPIVIGTFNQAFEFADTQDYSKFSNIFGDLTFNTNDVFYRFTIEKPMDIVVSRVWVSYNTSTNAYLLDSVGNIISFFYNSYLYSGTASYIPAQIEISLPKGTYYVVSEFYVGTGSIRISVKGKVTVNSFQRPIDAGRYSRSFGFSDTQDSQEDNFWNGYGWGAWMGNCGDGCNGIVYRFTLDTEMEVTISNYGSLLPETIIDLIDSLNHIIIRNEEDYGDFCHSTTQCSISRILAAGTYFVKVCGVYVNGVIMTNISGKRLDATTVTYTYSLSGHRTSRSVELATLSAKWPPENLYTAKPEEPADEIIEMSETTRVYPNPTKGMVYVETPTAASPQEIYVYSLQGKCIIRDKIADSKYMINLNNYPKGMYIINIVSDEKTQSFKVIKN